MLDFTARRMIPDLSKELATACSIAYESGALILEYHGRWSGRAPEQAVSMKPGGEPVTEADQAASALCLLRLSHAFPGDGLLSEEQPDNGSWLRAPRTWMVDPIDGTRDFIAGRPGFSTMIGLLIGGRPVLGVVYQPLADTLYYATLGQGAFRKTSRGGEPERLRVSEVRDLSQARMVSSASHPQRVVQRIREESGIRTEVSIGSVGIKLSLIAAGESDLYINPSGKTKVWDTCGPEVILREAGGRLSTGLGEELDYSGCELRHPHWLVASNGWLHQAALDRLAPFLLR